MSKQTAVEWFVDELEKVIGKSIIRVMQEEIDQAKAMEKEQMRKAAIHNTTKASVFRKIFEEQFEKYFNETYKGGEKSPPTTNNQ